MIKRNQILVYCLLLTSLSACSQTETSTPGGQSATNDASTPIQVTGKAPPTDVVRAEAANVEIKGGGSAEVSVKLTIAAGYHINANPPSFPYLKATELNVEPSVEIATGTPVYPASITRKFGFSKDPLAVYEGETAIKLPVTAAADAKKGAKVLKGKLRIQACDEEACYPPRTIEIPIPVTVK